MKRQNKGKTTALSISTETQLKRKLLYIYNHSNTNIDPPQKKKSYLDMKEQNKAITKEKQKLKDHKNGA